MLLHAIESLLIIVDVQASLMPMVVDPKGVVAVTNKLTSIARELEVPVIITEHYPEGLKPTVPEISEHLGEDYRPILKRVFSCCGEERFVRTVEETGRRMLVLTGIETHICVLQTALQLKELGYRVFVAADGVSCRSKFDHDIALSVEMRPDTEDEARAREHRRRRCDREMDLVHGGRARLGRRALLPLGDAHRRHRWLREASAPGIPCAAN